MRLTLEHAAADGCSWDAIARAIVRWGQAEGIALRDAVVLLPFAQLLPLARDAFARSDGWMPRIETTRTLASSLGPAQPAQPDQISFDATTDALNAAALLRSQAWGEAWARRDPRGFDQAAGSLLQTSHALLRAASALPASERPAHWERARAELAPIPGPGATERLLARVAVEWASLAPPAATDRLFALAPSAWIAVQAGGPEALTTRLMLDSAAPCLMLDTDAPPLAPFSALAANHVPALAICDGFEHEAQCAAAQVLMHVQRGEVPVGLIAQDRVLMRRVRALLERETLRLLDETGWKLSTTRAAAQVMTLLQAARADATTDALLDWLKAGTAWTRVDDGAALSSLESACRRGAVARAQALNRIPLEPPAARLWASARAALNEVPTVRRQPLHRWLVALAEALRACGSLDLLQADDAGRQVIAALRLAPWAAPAGAGWVRASQVPMGFDEFRGWVDAVLEQAIFLPTAMLDAPPQAVITPLARAMLRPFAAIVFAGADDRRLGAVPASDPLLSDTHAGALGVPDSAQRRNGELLAFAQVLAAPHVTFMRRRVDGSDPLADSPLVERLALALAVRGQALAVWRDPRIELRLVPTPIHMSAPSAPSLLPARVSASACEALRACPYRFFALNMLRLREDDELEREVEKRDYGTWLHALLFDFHRSRQRPDPSDVEIARLMALAAASQATDGPGEAAFLPFTASFAGFAPRYVAWLHRRDADGASWLRGEDELSIRPAEMEGTELRGIVDRIDSVRDGEGNAIELIDYKTGGVAGLREKVRRPLEDTQLAFYAALMLARSELPMRAIYLALDGRNAPEQVEHEGVADSAAALVDGLAHDWRRLRAGAGLPALGVGSTCEHCAARGVCRRDHWADGVSAEVQA